MADRRPATIQWVGNVEGHLELLDQRQLPTDVVILPIHTVEEVWDAIKTLAVRGAPAIGVAAAFGMVLAARTVPATSQSALLVDTLETAGRYLKSSRPTAVNLEWAVEEMLRVARAERAIGVRQLQVRLLEEAQSILRRDAETCLAIGRNGMEFLRGKSGVLTHCNAGALAAADHGTALAIVYEAHRRGLQFKVYADETRPLLQGARLTAWELAITGIDVTLICDNMAGLVMKQGKVDIAIVGADRIASNGDAANKIGTYSVAVLSKAHRIPLIIAAPTNTFDLNLASGDLIPIEERAPEEITEGFGKRTGPLGVKTYNPAFDVVPAELITAIVTERGAISPVNDGNVLKVLGK